MLQVGPFLGSESVVILFQLGNATVFLEFQFASMGVLLLLKLASVLLGHLVKQVDEILLLFLVGSGVPLLEFSQLPAVTLLLSSEVVPVSGV